MSVKGKMLEVMLPLFIYVLARMLHPVFYVIMAGLLIYNYRRLSRQLFIVSMMITAFFVVFFFIPEGLHAEYVKGKIVALDQESIVVKSGYHKVKVYGDFQQYAIYDDIALYGEIHKMNMPENDHAFDYQRYLYSLNIFDCLDLKEVADHRSSHHLYHFLEQRVNQSEQLKSLVSLFVLGTKDEQMKEYYEKLTELSLVHLFALSGMHLSILKKWLCSFLKFFFAGKGQNIAAVMIISIYVWLIPYNISFLRAYLMMILPMLFHRYFNRMDIFSLLTVGMLWYNPYLIYNLSFIFSYLVYMVILLFQNNRRMSYLLVFASLPVILSVNYKINVMTLLLGVIVTPLVEMLYQCILFYLIFGKWAVGLVSLVFAGFTAIMEFLYDHSFYLYFPRPNLFFILAYYLFFAQIILKVNMNRKISHELCCLISVLIAFYFYPFYNMQGKVVMISVGQGDCFLIRQPFDRGNILIDTGGLEYRDVAKETVIPYLYSEGIRSLDAVFISHDDFDHCGALPSLMNHFSVQEVIYDFEEKTIGDLTFYNLALDKAYFDKNDRSTVIYVTINKLNYLFTGDISEVAEKDLYQTYGSLDVDVLKVGHHGSGTSTSKELLMMCRPKIALISVGENNFYGHPHPDVLQRLKDYGVTVYRSDRDGMVKIYYYCNGENYIDRCK